MRIVVLGATGPLGKRIVVEATARGHALTVVTRNRQKYASEIPKGIDVVEGNALDPQLLRKTLTGADAVASALGGPPQGTPMPQEERLHNATQRLVEAMSATGVSRLLYVSAWGIGESRRNATPLLNYILRPIMLKDEYADKELQEVIVKNSPLNWTIVRPTVLTDGMPAGYSVGTDLRFPIWNYIVPPMVSRADVAKFILEEIERARYSRQAVLISGS